MKNKTVGSIKTGDLGALRKRNKELILHTLSKRSMPAVELQGVTGLSKTGCWTIIEDLVQNGILYKTEVETGTKGRPPQYLKISEKCGLVAVIKFTEAKAGLYTLGGDTVCEKIFNVNDVVTPQIIEDICRYLSDELQKRGIALLNMCIAVPGLVDKNSGELIYAPYFQDFETLNLKLLFERRFHTDVYVKNDLKFSLLAEKNHSPLGEKIHDTLYIQLGSGIGSSLYLDGKLYEGARGLSGEIGRFHLDYDSDSYGEVYVKYGSYHHLLELAKERLAAGQQSILSKIDVEGLKIEDIARGYRAGDRLCCDLFEFHARITAKVIQSCGVIIDFNNVIIAKHDDVFDDSYIEMLSRFVNAYTGYSKKEVVFSQYKGDEVTRGVLDFAIENAISKI